MRDLIQHRLEHLRKLGKHPLLRAALVLWGISGVWELALSQWIPDEYARRLPKVYQVIAMSVGFTSWQVWLLVGAAILVLGVLEFSFRRNAATVVVSLTQQVATTHPQTHVNRWMTVYETLHYLAYASEWGVSAQEVGPGGMRRMPLLEAPFVFNVRAAQGGIRATGRPNGAGTHAEIPDTYWLTATISPQSLHDLSISETMPTVPNQRGITIYTDVRIAREDISRTWPQSEK